MIQDENIRMPIPPPCLNGEHVKLKFIEIIPGNIEKGCVPYYHFDITHHNDIVVGHINLRIGDTPHIINCAGHIGFEVMEAFRGKSFSYFACLALKPFAKSFYESVILTANPQNIPSIHIIQKLGCEFINEVEISSYEMAYLKGERLKRRYRWIL